MWTIPPELYKKYRDQVVAMSLFRQEYDGYMVVSENTGLTDAEIARRLGLTEREVTEIRCVAEIDILPLESWEKADLFKELQTKKLVRKPNN